MRNTAEFLWTRLYRVVILKVHFSFKQVQFLSDAEKKCRALKIAVSSLFQGF